MVGLLLPRVAQAGKCINYAWVDPTINEMNEVVFTYQFESGEVEPSDISKLRKMHTLGLLTIASLRLIRNRDSGQIQAAHRSYLS